MKKHFLIVACILQVINSFANMASYYKRGTRSASMITSQDIDILSEQITMNIDPEFKTCDYIIDYIIESDTSGVILPLAFIALDYKNQFEVLFNDNPIQLINCDTCPSQDLPFEEIIKDGKDHFFVYWYENSGWGVDKNELKYFNIPLTKGTHNIRVKYTANVWTDLSGWTKEYSFRYSLSPAETWKSFGTLKVKVTSNNEIKCNLGLPTNNTGNKHIWNFSELPGKVLAISYQTKPHWLAHSLIVISPEGLWVIFALLMLLIHSLWIKVVNKTRIPKYALEIGGLSIVLVVIDYIFYLYTYPMIDLLIGEEASRYHGYYFLMIIFLPGILLVHWIIIHRLNIKWRNKTLNN